LHTNDESITFDAASVGFGTLAVLIIGTRRIRRVNIALLIFPIVHWNPIDIAAAGRPSVFF
jgi:hypothetical protein